MTMIPPVPKMLKHCASEQVGRLPDIRIRQQPDHVFDKTKPGTSRHSNSKKTIFGLSTTGMTTHASSKNCTTVRPL